MLKRPIDLHVNIDFSNLTNDIVVSQKHFVCLECHGYNYSEVDDKCPMGRDNLNNKAVIICEY